MLQLELTLPLSRLVLIGGGEFSFGETREVDDSLVQSLPAGNKTVAFIPTASGSPDYAKHFGAYLQGIDPAVVVTNVPIYRGRDVRRQRSLEVIRNAGLVYIGGGMASSLLAVIRESPVAEALKEAAASGVAIAAIGGAASCFGWQARGSTNAVAALDWIAHTVIETGFSAAEDGNLRRLMSVAGVQLGIGIPPGTAIAVSEGGATEVLGNGQIAAFRKSRDAGAEPGTS